jgi:hypothetical protein
MGGCWQVLPARSRNWSHIDRQPAKLGHLARLSHLSSPDGINFIHHVKMPARRTLRHFLTQRTRSHPRLWFTHSPGTISPSLSRIRWRGHNLR